MNEQPIFIIGFTAVGKTTIGRRLAMALGWDFVDTDEYLQCKYHSSISDMMGACGMDKFRKREKAILIELAQRTRCVIATGGGVAVYDNNLSTMQQYGITIYLQASPNVLAERLDMVKYSRPAVREADFIGVQQYVQETLPSRLPYYEQADITVSAEQLATPTDEERIVAEILHSLQKNHIS